MATKDTQEYSNKMIESIASDLIFGSTSGKVIQLKHFLSAVLVFMI